MKKRLWSMLLVVVMLTSLLPMSALAADPAHTCVPGTWTGDGVNHQTVCTDAACGKTITEACVDADANYACDVCGAHVCGEWALESVDGTNHQSKCTYTGCGKTKDVTAHIWVKDETNSTAANAVYTCACGANKNEHVHVWESTYTADAAGHTYKCTDTACVETKVEKHTWAYQSTDAAGTNATFKCTVCGQTMTEHKHVWGDLQWDATAHYRKCADPTCTVLEDYGVHVDGTGNGICDGHADCWYEGMTGSAVVYKQLVISDLETPVAGNKIDFTVSASPMEFGSATVKWNRVTNLSKNTSAAMDKNNVFAAGKMYNVGITFTLNKGATFADDFYVTLNGVDVPVYKKSDDFNKAIKAYNGNSDVSAALIVTDGSGKPYISVCKMFAQLSGECSHPNLDYDKGPWLYNATNHYQQCDICGDVLHVVKHFDFNKNGTCDRCGYNPNNVTTTGGTHKHSWSTDWVEDISNHWHQCSTCGAKKDLAAHADGNNNGNCDVCGFVMTAATGHTHSFATTWTETAYQHYHLCSCGAKNDIGAHVDKNNSGLCDDCGYTMTAALNAAANGTVANVGGGTNTLGGTVIPGTGDSTNMTVVYLWLAAFAVSVLGLGGSALAWRKRKES